MSKNKYFGNGFTELVKGFFHHNPKSVNDMTNNSFFYYQFQLMTKLKSVLTVDGYPSNWNIDNMWDVLLTNGYIPIVKTDIGTLALEGGFYGQNMYYMPTNVLVNNPVLRTIDEKIGEKGELLYINYEYNKFQGVMSLINRYAVLLANIDCSLNVSLYNSRVAHVFEAETDAQVKSLQKMYDDVSRGNPAVFLKKGMKGLNKDNDSGYFLNVKNTYIGNDLLVTKRSIMNEFLTEIGINNANTDKRERLNSDEVNANNSEVRCTIVRFIDTLNECAKKINENPNFDDITNLHFSINTRVIDSIKQEMVVGNNV